MNRDRIIELAREARIILGPAPDDYFFLCDLGELERFTMLVIAESQAAPVQDPDDLTIAYMVGYSKGKDAALVAAEAKAEEREACAKVCEDFATAVAGTLDNRLTAFGDDCAAAIRARGE